MADTKETRTTDPTAPEVLTREYTDGTTEDIEIIRLNRLRTEVGWIVWVDRLVLKLTPAWFQFLGWILILAALQYLLNVSGSRLVGVLVALSGLAIWRYLIAVCYRYELRGLPYLRSKKAQYYFSSVLSGILAYAAYCFAAYVAAIAAANQNP